MGGNRSSFSFSSSSSSVLESGHVGRWSSGVMEYCALCLMTPRGPAAAGALMAFLGAQRPDRAFCPRFSALDPKSLGGVPSMPVICGHMVSRSINKTRTARVHARKPLLRRGLSRVRRSIRDRTERLIQLYLELGLPWPNALQAAVADLQQLTSRHRQELFSPA